MKLQQHIQLQKRNHWSSLIIIDHRWSSLIIIDPGHFFCAFILILFHNFYVCLSSGWQISGLRCLSVLERPNRSLTETSAWAWPCRRDYGMWFVVHLLGLHVPAGEVFDAVHEAVLRHLVVGPQKLLKLKHKHTIQQVFTQKFTDYQITCTVVLFFCS